MIDTGLINELEAVTRPLADANGLPNRSYTDPALFAYERDAVFARSWSAVCFASDLPEAGFAMPVDFMGLPLLVVRNRDGDIKVFHNVCRHRGMLLVQEAAPLRTVIRCPYHSWAYDFDGKLVSTPHIGGSDLHDCAGFDKSGHGLRAVRSSQWFGMVFVNLSGDAEPFSDFTGPLLERWSPFISAADYDSLQTSPAGSRMELSVECNWKLAVENYCEAYHLPWVHPALNTYSPLSDHYNIVTGERMSGQGSRNYQLASVSAQELPRLRGWPAEQLQHAEYISLYPNVLLGIQVDHVFALILQPINESRTTERLELRYVGHGASDDRYDACRDAVLQSWKLVFGEDVAAVEGLQRGRRSAGFDGGVFTPVQDVPTHHFHQWVARRYLQS